MGDDGFARRTAGQIKEPAKLVPRENPNRGILRLLHVLLEDRLLFLEERVDPLLDGIGDKKPDDLQRPVPPKPMRPLHGLVLYRRVPPPIKEDHDGGAGQVKPNASGPKRYE